MGYLSRERVCGSRMRGPPFFQVTLVFTAVFIAGDLVVRIRPMRRVYLRIYAATRFSAFLLLMKNEVAAWR